MNGQKFEGVDLFLFHPHTDPDASDDELRQMADKIAAKGLAVGSLVAPVWPGTVGGSAMGSDEDRAKFVLAVKKACRIAKMLNEHGVRKYGIIRIDSADGPAHWDADPAGNTKKIAATFREAAKVAEDHGERLAAEGEICWAGMHSWKDMLDLLEEVGMPETVGFQADQAHTYLYLLGYNAEQHALLKPGYSAGRVRRRLHQDDRRPPPLDDRLPRRPERRHRPRHRQPRQDRPPLPRRRPQRQARHRQSRRLLAQGRRLAAASGTSAGTAACSPTPCSRGSKPGTRSSPP